MHRPRATYRCAVAPTGLGTGYRGCRILALVVAVACSFGGKNSVRTKSQAVHPASSGHCGAMRVAVIDDKAPIAISLAFRDYLLPVLVIYDRPSIHFGASKCLE